VFSWSHLTYSLHRHFLLPIVYIWNNIYFMSRSARRYIIRIYLRIDWYKNIFYLRAFTIVRLARDHERHCITAMQSSSIKWMSYWMVIDHWLCRCRMSSIITIMTRHVPNLYPQYSRNILQIIFVDNCLWFFPACKIYTKLNYFLFVGYK